MILFINKYSEKTIYNLSFIQIFNIDTYGTLYYNPEYDYSKIIEMIPETWTAKPLQI